MAKIEEKVESLLSKTIEDLGYELYDVIYEKEAQDYYLRIFIDTPKGISLEDCEKVNDAIEGLLDEADYIKDQYFLEVSSPGVERLLRKEKHLQASIGKEVTCHLFQPITINESEKSNIENIQEKKQGKQKSKNTSLKQIEGILQSFDKEKLMIQVQQEKEPIEMEIDRKNVATLRLKYNW